MVVQKELFGEGKHVEFKADIPKKRERFLKDVIAFSNTSGGKVILGVEDETREVVGLGDRNPFKLADAIANMVSDSCTPEINMEITPKTIDGKTVLEIEVFPGRLRPYYLISAGREKSAYIRVNGTSRPAHSEKIKELEMEGRRISYDTLLEIGAKYDAAAVSKLMESMYRTALAACRSPEERADVHPLTVEKLEDFGLLRKEGNSVLPTRAFTLLTQPIDRYVKIQCALFKGCERDEFIDRKEFRGPVQEQVEDAFQFVLRHINRGSTIEGLYRRDRYELPTRSIRETIANACLHRSYLDSGSIQVSIYDDRLEVDSPGMLFEGLSVKDALSGKSKCRNKAIAEAFQYMKIIEGWGTGLPRLFAQCREMGLPEPKFEEFGDGVKVTIYRADGGAGKDEFGTKNGEDDTRNGGDDTKTGEFGTKNGENDTRNGENDTRNGENDTRNRGDDTVKVSERLILDLLKSDGKMTQDRLADRLGVSPSTVKRKMAELQNKGLIERVGSTKSGCWKVNDPR
ncbi:MAG: putative DNA binding domain-containing protein [Thermoguttaceae bacterium]|nr:putative DNA binding domain-containing protein [Thermoguttaceae bacterium]